MTTTHGHRPFWRRAAFGLSLLTVVTVALTLANAWMVVHRREGYLFRYVPQSTIYSPAEALRIVGFAREPYGLILKTEPALDGTWEVRTAEGASYDVPGPHPRIRLTPGVHEVRLEQRLDAEDAARVGALPRVMDVSLVVDEPAPGQHGVGETSVLSMSVPFGNATRHPLSTLATRPEHYPPTDVAEGRRILEGLDLPEGDTVARIERIMAFVYRELDAHRGVPSDAMLHGYTPLTQLERARRGEDAVHCANFTAVYTFFATLADIPTREITVTGERDGVLLGGHTFAESYLPEHGAFAYVDATFGMGLVQTPDGTYLGAVRLARLHDVGTIGELTVGVVGEDGTVRREPYEDHARFSRLYLNRDATYMFHRPERDRHSIFARVFRLAMGSDLSYALEPATERHWFKQAALLAQLAVGVIWLVVLARWAVRRARRVPREADDGTPSGVPSPA